TSVNEVVCHGIPSPKTILQSGDIINVDVTPILNSYYGDTSRTFIVGGEQATSQVAKNLVQCAKDALHEAILILNDSAGVTDIASTITQIAQQQGFSVVYDFVGHGIGKTFHEEPNIQHCYFTAKKQPTIKLPRGMTFTIEPMINQKGPQTRVLSDGWTAVTTDGGLSAQFEHTIAILPNGEVDILTLP
ncbi:MAG: type I methionyl aminopeptidase, partial [Proteobacteria bacterium]|nr:type I methionyl aminopeptidase [Pseudomonadota bacterium]